MTSAGLVTPRAADAAAYRAVEHIYHSYLTGLILMLASRAGSLRAAEVVFRTFRRQQLARFLPGLKKLGLDQLPHAVACAQYHYLSNQVGGVKVEYVHESDTKAWVRYPPPRWIWSGTAICGIPSDVSRAMLRGWHANNGVVLGNPRLGFVCTGQTVDGQPGLEGYYKEWDRDLAPEERLQFSPGERCPPFRADLAPRLPGNAWPEERLQKVLRNYAMEYITSQNKIDDPYVQHHIGQMSVNVETAHLWLRHVARLWETGRYLEAQLAGSRARHVVEHLAESTVKDSIRACGARCLIRPSTLERVYRDLSFYVRHDNDDHILATIGKSVLGLTHDPSFYKP